MSNHLKMVVYLSLGLLLVLSWHFATVFGLVGTPLETRAAFFVRIGVIIGAFIISSAVVASLIARRDESEVLPDEREELIELKAERYGALAIYAGSFFLMWFVFTPLTPMQVANAILGVLCVAELVKIVSGLLLLRRGRLN